MARGTWGGNLDRHPYAIRISWTSGTDIHQTGFHLRSVGANVSSPQETAEAVAGWVTDNFRTLLHGTQRILSIDSVDMVTREGFAVAPANQTGTLADSISDLAPAFVAVVATLRGELRTRYGQGRMFFPVLREAWITRDVLEAAGATAIQSAITALATLFIGNSVSGHNMINVHGTIPPRAASGTTPARPEIPPSWYDVTSIRLNNAVTALRSRKAGVGS